MRLVFAGTPAAALPSLRALLDHPVHEVVAVVTRPDKPAGRGRTLVASPVKQLALEANVGVLQPAKTTDPEFVEQLQSLHPDCCPVVAYGALLRPQVLDIPAHGWVNLHFSVLPAWRGAAPVQHAILAGDEVTGASTFRIEEGLDTGPIFGVVTTDVGARETAGELMGRLAVAGADLLVATLDGIADGSVTPIPQPADGVSLAPKIAVDDARVDWSPPALRIDRLVRACTPDPGPWTTFRGKRVKLGPVNVVDGLDGVGELAPGELHIEKHLAVVGTGSRPVALGDVQPEGKPSMHAVAWLRGLRPVAGDAFA
ncbi:MAG: methionyl-tRNA formyltransferase [Frankiales bacterium]|nr:methionyl-tRNA formyltransferase [Frankiales bacterium]